MGKQKKIILAILFLIILVIGFFIVLFLIKKQKPRMPVIQQQVVTEEQVNKNEQQTKEQQIHEQAYDALNPLVCDTIEDEERKKACIINVEQGIENLKKESPGYMGTLFLNAGNYDEAINIFESLIGSEDRRYDATLYLSIAMAYAEKSLINHEPSYLEKALEWVNKSIEIEPINLEGYRVKGYIYEVKNDPFAAIDNYNKSLEIYSEYIPAYVGRCHANSLAGLLGKALEDCQKAVELDKEKNFPVAYLHLCRLQMSSEEKRKEAVGNCQVVIDSMANNNDKAAAYQMIATIKIDQGILNDEVEDLIKEAISHSPQDPNGFLTLAIFYNKKENFEKAKENAQKAINLDAKKSVAFGELGYAYLKTNNSDKAVENIRKAINLINEDPSLLITSKEFYKNRYCNNLKIIYQEKNEEFKEPICQ